VPISLTFKARSIKDALAESPQFHVCFTKSYKRLPGENLIDAAWTIRSGTWRDGQGLLYLTDQRLLFAATIVTLWWPSAELRLGDIDAIGDSHVPWYVRLRGFFFLSPWYVSSRGYRYYFITLWPHKASFLRQLSELTGLTPQ